MERPGHHQEQSEWLSLHQCGKQACAPSYRFGPAVRDHYLIHCIFQGEGRFEASGKSYTLGAGQGFLIVPWQTTVYTADAVHPWVYRWMGFSGRDAAALLDTCGLSAEQPVLAFHDIARMDRCLEDLLRRYDAGDNAFSLIAGIYRFFALLLEDVPSAGGSGNHTLDVAVDHIRKNYSYPLTVEETARRCGGDRSHLFRLFKRHLGISPQQYLLNLRLTRAQELLRGTDLSVTEVAFSCGFSDISHFSRSFHQAFGIPPRDCRNTVPPQAASQD